MPARETRNSGRSPRAARPAASRPTSGSTVSSRSAAARRADASAPRRRNTSVSVASGEPPHAGHRPSASGSGPLHSTHVPEAPFTRSSAAAPGRASASSSAAAVGNRSSTADAVAWATTSSSQAGTPGATRRGRNPSGSGVGGRCGDGRSGSSPVSA